MHKPVAVLRPSVTAIFRKTYRLAAAIAIIAAVAWQLIYSSTHYSTFDPVNFFSFFTIEANLIGVIALVWLVFSRKQSPTLEIFRGAATLYLAITGIVFAVLLTNIEVDLTLPAVDLILHKIIPIVIVLDWLIDPPRLKFTTKQLAMWFVYPIVWLVYTLLRGLLANWYPYPFLDPRLPGGYGQVMLYSVGILVFAIAIAWLLTLIPRLVRNYKRHNLPYS